MSLAGLEIDRKSYKPVSDQIEDFLRRKIVEHDFEPGTRLPTTNEMVAAIQVSNKTIREALGRLECEGLIESTPGRGTFVIGTNKKRQHANISRGNSALRNIAIISVFFSDLKDDSGEMQIQHPRTLAGIFDKCREINSRCCIMPRSVNLESFDDVYRELLRGEFDGAIWLYPKVAHLPVIKSLIKEQIKVVITSHSHIGLGLPSVEGDEAGAGVQTVDHFIRQRCPKILVFWEDVEGDITDPLKVCTGGHISWLRTIKDTFVAAGHKTEDVEIVPYQHRCPEFRDVFFDKLRTAEAGSGLIFNNSSLFRELFARDMQELTKLLNRHKPVITTDISNCEKLAPLAKSVEFYTSIVCLGTIGQIAVQKLSNILSGQIDNTRSLVGTEFRKFE